MRQLRLLLFLPALMALAGSLCAQDTSEEAIEAAVRFAIGEGVAGELGDSIVFETEHFGHEEIPGMRERAERLAASMGARTGSVDAILTCRDTSPPPPEWYGRGWCRLEEGVRNLVQVRGAVRAELGWKVRVRVYGFSTSPPDRYSVHADAGTVLVTRRPDGSAAARYVGIHEHADWP